MIFLWQPAFMTACWFSFMGCRFSEFPTKCWLACLPPIPYWMALDANVAFLSTSRLLKGLIGVTFPWLWVEKMLLSLDYLLLVIFKCLEAKCGTRKDPHLCSFSTLKLLTPERLTNFELQFPFPTLKSLSKVLSFCVPLVLSKPNSLQVGRRFQGKGSGESWIHLNVFCSSVSWIIKFWLPSLSVIHSYTFFFCTLSSFCSSQWRVSLLPAALS